ncbi:hypothetical protein M407DRAFT_241370 [Tulasnella calospora MUT 4182]|uniref:Metallothionein n=1 Tax=Tulasnella calospora MUT 4182 TaxID=1051891 RepID=A0A0C3QJH7_9AGAM|nr:hypothetical protein M407DRAFT_241370 [Tulasnella calospora MUT 4182]
MPSCETTVKNGSSDCTYPECGCTNPPKNPTSATTGNCADCPGDCKPGECKR